MIDPLRPACELGTSDSRRSVGAWCVLGAMVVASVASFSLAASMLGPESSQNLTEAPVADGPWLIEWGRTMRPPSVEQAGEVRALRLVVGGAAALISIMCLLIVAGHWRQRLVLRRSEYFVHRALGARRVQLAARLVGEGRWWAGAILALSALSTAIIFGIIELTFPGEASVSPNVAASAILLTGLAVVLMRWEADSGDASMRVDRGRAWELIASPPIVGAIGFAVLSGVGIFAIHAPYASASTGPADGSVIGASLVSLPVGSRGDEVLAWADRTRALGAQVGFASAGASRGAGHSELATIECGECFDGVWYMPIKLVRAEVHALAPDTFVHLGVSLLRGRDFDAVLDRGRPSVAIVSESLANRHFEGGVAVGKQLRFGDSDWLTVVGVIGDRHDTSDPDEYAIYVALAQARPSAIEVLAEQPPSGLPPILAAAPPGAILGLAGFKADVFGAAGWFRNLLNSLGLAALGLVAAGLWVSARNEADATRYEVSVRRAVGAKRGHVWWFYLSFAGRRLFGCLIGGAWLSLFLGAGLGEAYDSIPQVDWAVWGGAAAWVSVVYMLASASPFMVASKEALVPRMDSST